MIWLKFVTEVSVQAKEIETQVESMDSFKILKYVSINKLLKSTMNIDIYSFTFNSKNKDILCNDLQSKKI